MPAPFEDVVGGFSSIQTPPLLLVGKHRRTTKSAGRCAAGSRGGEEAPATEDRR